MEPCPTVCQIPGCETTQDEVDAEISTFLFDYCATCKRQRNGNLCGCPYPCTLTFRTAMLQRIHELLEIPLSPDRKSIKVCFKHSSLITQAREAVNSTKNIRASSATAQKFFRIKYKSYNEVILLRGIRSLSSLFHDVIFLCCDGKSVSVNSLLVSSLSKYMKDALRDSSYSFSLPDVPSEDLELFFKYLITDPSRIALSASTEEMIKIHKIARLFCVYQFTPQEVAKSENNDLESSEMSDNEAVIEDTEEEMEVEFQGPVEEVSSTRPDPIYLNAEANMYTCIICSQTMNKSVDIIDHYEKNHGRRAGLDCDLCEEEPPHRQYFPNPVSLGNHRLEQHGTFDELTNCDLCPEPCFTKQRLDSHIKVCHLNEYELSVCDLCGARFPRDTYLNKHHLAEHAGTEIIANEFICIYCDLRFDNLEKLNEHTEAVHYLGSWSSEEPPEKRPALSAKPPEKPIAYAKKSTKVNEIQLHVI
ncbi:uncharacterized protein [Lepeophtheirus salmonis]|uniref:uncharacterized protein n=1 Tax=Lepeophtheirus salmonis TaxID=72036 RepID=UPI001AE2BC41|nr:uncharacterized protein LOC121115891 [Lepeophtheirus salmonis]